MLKSNLKIAYLDVNVRYLNPTRNMLMSALSVCGDVTHIGPGFSTDAQTKQFEDVLLRPGYFDVIVTTPHIVLGEYANKELKDIARIYRKAFVVDFPSSEFKQLVSLKDLLAKTKLPKVLFLLEADYYNFDRCRIDTFDKYADVILGFGPEVWSRKSAMPHLQKESFADMASDQWACYLETCASMVSSMHHVVGDAEFCSRPLSLRRRPWSVMGVEYAARKTAKRTLREKGLSVEGNGLMPKLIGGLMRIQALKGHSGWSLDLLQRSFRSKLSDSKYSYTCGSGLDMPIRKFFEIPAAGSVLVCRSFRGSRELGFRAGENYLECEPSDIIDVHNFLERNPERAQEIADAGRELVLRKHSVDARAKQISLCLNALIKGEGVGRWVDGQYLVK